VIALIDLMDPPPEARSKAFRAAETVIVIASMLLLSDTGTRLLFPDLRAPFNNPKALAIQVAVYLLLLVVELAALHHIFAGMVRIKMVMLLVLFAGLSAFWSHAPAITLRRFPVLLAGTIFGIYFGTRFSWARQVQLLSVALGIAAIGSLLAVRFVPGLAIDHQLHSGDWQGLFITKNTLGKWMCLGAVASILTVQDRKFVGTLFVGLSLFLIYKSHSRTSLAVAVVIVCVSFSFRFLRMRMRELIPLLLIGCMFAVIAGYYVSQSQGTLLRAAGRDSTLSGRTGLWTFAMKAVDRRPMTGYGFDAFWMDDAGPVMIVVENVGWNPPHAHNGFIDILLGVGWIGLSIFLAGFAVVAHRAWVVARRRRDAYDVWPLMFLIYLVASNLTESSLFIVNSINWSLYVSIAATLAVRASQEAALLPEPGWTESFA
jgi:exopolysaccharide production protein ExoQ